MSSAPAWEPAFIGVGANLGDARATVLAAMAACESLPRTRAAGRSSLYRSAPVDAGGPDFVNAVLRLQTTLAPIELLDALQAIEQAHGRERPYRNAPRTLDLDLLLQGRRVMDTERLTLPHPRLHERAFVLLPLAELEPELVLPGKGPIGTWLPAVAAQRITRTPA